MAASFGEQLRLAREERGISLRHISDQTRISVRYLEAIEADDYKRLPGGIFNRSFIKAYAKQIGFDEKEAIEGYLRTNREQGESDEVATTPYKSHVYTDGGTRSPLVTLLLTILILAILSLGVYAAVHWYQRREASRTNDTPAPNPQSTQGANPAPQQTTPPAPATPTSDFHIEVTARGEDVYIDTYIDDSKRTRGILLKTDATEKFDPDDRLRIRFALVKAKALEVTINGRRARVPTDKTEMLITREGYEQQFIQ
jgi:cytoskeleton protein RodZ